MKVLVFFLTGIAVVFFIDCTSLPLDSLFLVNNLDNEEKSNVISEKGIKLYKAELESQENYQKLTEIKEYFIVALRFNPQNEKAEEYLGKINNFAIAKVEEKLVIAQKLFKKEKRSEEEDFTLIYAVRKAYELDPENEEVIRLKKETAGLTEKLAAKYMNQAEAELKKMKEDDSLLSKSKISLNAYDNCVKVLKIDPGNKQAESDKKEIESNLEVIIKGLLKDAKENLAKNDFKGTESFLNACKEINRKLDAGYDGDIAGLSYDLYYKWANTLLAKKDYNGAEAKIKAALRAKRTDEAVALKNKISRITQDTEFANSFKKWLEEIDALIAKKDLIAAYDKIQSILSKTDDKNRIKELKAREEKVRNELAGIYESALKFYKQENYKEAIKLLKLIVHIDAHYQQAGDYLEKAESRQELLDTH
ncbi:MAG: hypothetical protein JXB88_04265 [Spirochaetales bacterium]|nr:hypothetical protein [Spirochaetales bacterium]